MKIRFRFAKFGKVRWTSHRDVARMWERALRRGRLPLAYTAGFSPRPQLAFGLALPTGCESTAEYLDAVLTTDVEVSGLRTLLDPELPIGVDVLAAGTVDAGGGSLQEVVTSCSWEIEVTDGATDRLGDAIGAALSADQLPVRRERKGKVVVDDLRPSLLALEVSTSGPRTLLLAELGTRPRGVRPAELAQVLGLGLGAARRTHQWIERDGSRTEPLAVDAALAAAALGHAS